jgi:hypothetical protein
MEILDGGLQTDRGVETALRLGTGHVAASMRLDFERDAMSGRTVLAASHQEPPLKVVRAFGVEDGAALVHLHNVSGGLLGGDRLQLAVHVGAGARVQVTTTGATRIYRARAEALPTLQSNEIAVAENGLLEYLPDAVIPFAGARFSQRTTIRLAAGAGLFWWEVLAPGREAHGAIWWREDGLLPRNGCGWSRKRGVWRHSHGWGHIVRRRPFMFARWEWARIGWRSSESCENLSRC